MYSYCVIVSTARFDKIWVYRGTSVKVLPTLTLDKIEEELKPEHTKNYMAPISKAQKVPKQEVF
jgi:hypothetical protein